MKSVIILCANISMVPNCPPYLELFLVALKLAILAKVPVAS